MKCDVRAPELPTKGRAATTFRLGDLIAAGRD